MSTPHGLLLINKPSGITSHDVVARTRRILGMKSVGHSGTLDPLASGLMVLLLGEGTKLSQYILERNKAYRVKAKFGVETDTYDLTGQVVRETPVDLDPELVRSEALKIHGAMELPVPIFSAMKVDGKKLYEYARSETPIEVPKKMMEFFDLEIEAQTSNSISLFLRCSKGSFIRTWVHLLGQNLKVGAAMESLERVESMPYHLSQAITFEELEADVKTGGLTRGYIPMVSTLSHFKALRVKGQDQVLMNNGQISHDLRTRLISIFQPDIDEGVKIISEEGQLLSLVGLEHGKGFVVRRVFRYA